MAVEEEIRALKTIVKGAGILFLGVIISKIITFFYRLFIARYYGPEDYGLFSLGLALLGFAGVFASLSMQNGVTRYVAYYKARGEEEGIKGVITSSLSLAIPTSLLSSIILFVFSPFLAINLFNTPGLTNILRILSMAVFFSSLKEILAGSFVGFQLIKYRVYVVEILDNLAKLLTLFLFGILGLGVAGIALSWTLGSMIAALFAVYILERRVYPILRTKIKGISLRRELLSYSLPLAMWGLLGFIIGWTDTLMLGYFTTSIQVGIYNAALPVAILLTTVPGILSSLFIPILTEFYSLRKTAEMQNLFKIVNKWIFYLNFPFFLLLISFPKQVLKILFGTVYIEGYLALILLAIAFFIGSLMQTTGQMLQVLKKTNYLFLGSLIVAIANVTLNWHLIPIYGITGAAMSSALSRFASITLAFLWFWPMIGMTPFSKEFLKAIAAGIVSILFINFLARLIFAQFPSFILLLLFILFMILYGFLLLLFKGLGKEDLEILKAIEQKTGIRIEFIRKIVKRFGG
jgi:O-antigen/teichoic acid export membrane protein